MTNDGRCKLAPILRHPNSFSINQSVVGVHDYFSLNAQTHNSLYSGLHQQFKLGVPKQIRPLILAPILTEAKGRAVVKLTRAGVLRQKRRIDEREYPDSESDLSRKDSRPYSKETAGIHAFGALGDDLTMDESPGDEEQRLQEVQERKEKEQEEEKERSHRMELLKASERETQDFAEDMQNRANEMSLIKAKARSGLLQGLRDGQLEVLAKTMEEDAKKKIDEIQDLRKALDTNVGQDGVSQEMVDVRKEMEEAEKAMLEKIDRLAMIKNKAKKGLVEGLRDGSLSELAESFNDEQEAFIAQIAEDLEKDMREGAKAAIELGNVMSKARVGLVNAQKQGELESIYCKMLSVEEIMSDLTKQLKDLKYGIKKELLRAHRKADLEKVAKHLVQFVKSKVNVLGDLMSRDEETLNIDPTKFAHESRELQKIQEKLKSIAAEIAEGIEKKTLLNAIQIRNMGNKVSDISRLVEANTVDLGLVKQKAKRELLQMRKSGELEAMQKSMEKKAGQMKEARTNFANNLIGAYRNNELSKISESWDVSCGMEEFKNRWPDGQLPQEEDILPRDTIATWIKEREGWVSSLDLPQRYADEVQRQLGGLVAELKRRQAADKEAEEALASAPVAEEEPVGEGSPEEAEIEEGPKSGEEEEEDSGSEDGD